MARTLTRRRTATAEVTPEPEEEEAEQQPARRRRSEPAASLGRRSKRPTEDAEAPRVGKGWAAAKKQAGDGFAQNFKPSGEEIVIHFLDPEPFAVYKQHWIERPGKKSFACLQSIDKACPLCDDLGDNPRALSAFNVIDFTDPSDPELKVWEVGNRVVGTLENYAKASKTSPLNRGDLYFAVSRSGKGTQSTTSITPIKERDLGDDYEIDALDAEEIGEFADKAFDDSSIRFPTEAEAREIADELLDD